MEVLPLSQATAPVIPAPPACRSSATGEIIQWAAPRQASAASQNPARTVTESPDPVLLYANTQLQPTRPLATQQVLQYGAPPVRDSTGEF